MRMDEARSAIGDAISASITGAFTFDREQHDRHLPTPSVRLGDNPAGHDPSRIPPVPRTAVHIERDHADPSAVFSWKVESGTPPSVIFLVQSRWLYDVVRPGFAVIDGHPVLQILDCDEQGRPIEALVLLVTGHFDSSMHGWRAWGTTVPKQFSWETAEPSRVGASGTAAASPAL